MTRSFTFPKFSIFYADGTAVHGGGEGEEMVTFSLPKSWVEAPADGVVVVNVNSFRLGRRILCGAERYYAIPPEGAGGPDVGKTGQETSLGPLVRKTLGIVKDGVWVNDSRYHEIMVAAQADQSTMQQSATSSREVRRVRD